MISLKGQAPIIELVMKISGRYLHNPSTNRTIKASGTRISNRISGSTGGLIGVACTQTFHLFDLFINLLLFPVMI
jgi:hypothetical protein